MAYLIIWNGRCIFTSNQSFKLGKRSVMTGPEFCWLSLEILDRDRAEFSLPRTPSRLGMEPLLPPVHWVCSFPAAVWLLAVGNRVTSAYKIDAVLLKLHVSAGTRTPRNSGLIVKWRRSTPTTPIFRLWLTTTTLLYAFRFALKRTMNSLPNVPEGCGKLQLNEPGKGRRNCDGVRFIFGPHGGAVFRLALEDAGPLISFHGY